jgi:hypothetical protein
LRGDDWQTHREHPSIAFYSHACGHYLQHAECRNFRLQTLQIRDRLPALRLFMLLMCFHKEPAIRSLNFRRFVASKRQAFTKYKRSRDASVCSTRSSVESLETRTLLSESATAQIALTSTTGTAGSPVYHYQITVNDTGTTPIGTFWFGWIPDEDFLPSAPSAVQDPSGWTHTITGSNNSTDGSAIEWVATSNPIAAGASLNTFGFTTTDSPSALAANSPTHPASPATTAFVYSGAAFSDAGFQLVATPPAATSASTTTLVSSSPNSTAGVLVTLTATVAPSSGSGTEPTGTVTFTSNGTTIGSSPVGAGGVATLATAALAAGADQIVATYGGDSNFTGSASAALTQTVTPPVNATATTTTVTSSSLTAAPAASVTFTATIAPASSPTPTGTVTFSSNGTTLGTSPVQSNGTATLTTSSLPRGADPITATYNGDANYAASTSTAITETISAPATVLPAIVKSTLPTALVAGAATRGAETVSITNESGALLKGKTSVVIFASTTGNIDGSAVELSKPLKILNLKAGKKTIASIQLSLHANTLAAGTYMLIAQATDPSGNVSDSAAGETVIVAPAFIALSETVSKSTLPASAAGGSKSHALVTLTIANSGNIITPGTTTAALFLTAAGVVDSTATQIATLTKPLRIKPGKPLKATISVKQIPATTAASYTIVAQVTDPSHQITSATVGAITITA